MKNMLLKSNKSTQKALVSILMFVVLFTQIPNVVFAGHHNDYDDNSSSPCVVVDTLGDNTDETIGTSSEPSVQDIISSYGLNVGSQKQYQIWKTNKASTTFEVKFLNGYTAAGNVFGYYKKGDVNSFVPLFKNGNGSNSTYPSVSQATPGQTFIVTLPAGEYGFAMHEDFNGSSALRTSEISLNEASGDYAISYDVLDPSANPLVSKPSYIIAFEDLSLSIADKDYNDIVAQVTVKSCENPVNQAPVITLIGASVSTTTVGTLYIEQGATAHDYEDGDITADIVISGVVNTSTPGIYTVTYNVSDSQGLAAAPVIRTINVIPVSSSPSATIVATKIVCNAESDLPNWGDGSGGDISSTTATSYVATHSNCKLESDWQFQWVKASDSNINPGDNILTLAPAPWTTFATSTDSNGISSTTVPAGSLVWVREVLKDGYVTFSGVTTSNNVSAEIYCHTDHLNYDNWDWINPVTAGETYYCVAWNALKVATTTPPVNHAPVITLVGANPATVIVGNTFTDPGATAQDEEDGDITSSIVASSTVNTNIVGSYTITYNVKDSQGLAANEVSRTVNVLDNGDGGGGPVKGKITFCLITADDQNVVATTSGNLPAGSFTMNLATSTDVSTSTIQTKVWASSGFAPNTKIISSTINDADCVTYSDLDLGTYYYSQLSVSGSLWNTPKYNDKFNQTINNVFDFFNYSPELFNATTTDDVGRNMNSDGQIVLTSGNKEQSVVVYNTHDPIPSLSSDLTVSKISDKTAPSVGDNVTYTITVSNLGPQNASGVTVNDSLPAGLEFVSATSTVGSYSTTTGIWTIGSFPNGSSTALTLIVKILSGQEGKKISNVAIASSTNPESNSSDNSSTADVNVILPPCTVNCSNGGGGGGNGGGGGGNGPIVGSFGNVNTNGPIVSAPIVAGASTTSCYYLYDYLRKDFNNNPIEVKKLQVFLRDLEGHTNLPITGIYDDATISAVNSFQNKYKDEILTPWGHTAPTSYVYILTKKKVNEIYCKTAFPVTSLQQQEIDAYRTFLESLKKEGITPGQSANGNVGSVNNPSKTPTKVDKTGSTSGLTTLAGVSSTTKKIAGDMIANVLSAGKRLSNTLLSFIAWPFGSSISNVFDKASQCVVTGSLLFWINLLLIFVIIVLSYLWYKEYENNKVIENINKEIDLQ